MTERELPPDEDYLVTDEAAELLRVSVEIVLAWIHSGELRALDVRSRGSKRPRWRIRRDWLEAWARSRMTIPPPQARRPARRQHVIEFYR